MNLSEQSVNAVDNPKFRNAKTQTMFKCIIVWTFSFNTKVCLHVEIQPGQLHMLAAHTWEGYKKSSDANNGDWPPNPHAPICHTSSELINTPITWVRRGASSVVQWGGAHVVSQDNNHGDSLTAVWAENIISDKRGGHWGDLRVHSHVGTDWYAGTESDSSRFYNSPLSTH